MEHTRCLAKVSEKQHSLQSSVPYYIFCDILLPIRSVSACSGCCLAPEACPETSETISELQEHYGALQASLDRSLHMQALLGQHLWRPDLPKGFPETKPDMTRSNVAVCFAAVKFAARLLAAPLRSAPLSKAAASHPIGGLLHAPAKKMMPNRGCNMLISCLRQPRTPAP